MKKVIVIYDIVDDKVRNNIVEILQNNMFIRIQNSVFIGQVRYEKIVNLKKVLRKNINIVQDKICILIICEKCYKKGKYINTKNLNEMLKSYFIL